MNEKIFDRALENIVFKEKEKSETRDFLLQSQTYKKALEKDNLFEREILVFMLSREESLEELFQKS